MIPTTSSHQIVNTQSLDAAVPAVQTNPRIASYLSRWEGVFPAGTEALTLKQWLFIEIVERTLGREQNPCPWERISQIIDGLSENGRMSRSELGEFFINWRKFEKESERQSILLMGLLYQMSDEDLALPMSSFNLTIQQGDCPIVNPRIHHASRLLMGSFLNEIVSDVEETIDVIEKQCTLLESISEKRTFNKRKKRGEQRSQYVVEDSKYKEMFTACCIEMRRLCFVLQNMVKDFRQVDPLEQQSQDYDGTSLRELEKTIRLLTGLLQSSHFLLSYFERFENKMEMNKVKPSGRVINPSLPLIMSDEMLEGIIEALKAKEAKESQNDSLETAPDQQSLEEPFRNLYRQVREKFNVALLRCDKRAAKKFVIDSNKLVEGQLKSMKNLVEGVVMLTFFMNYDLYGNLGIKVHNESKESDNSLILNEEWDKKFTENKKKIVNLLIDALRLFSGIESNLLNFRTELLKVEQPEIDWSEFEQWDVEVRSVRRQRQHRTRSSSSSSAGAETIQDSDEDVPGVYQEEPVQDTHTPDLAPASQFIDGLAYRSEAVDVVVDDCMKQILDIFPENLHVPAEAAQEVAPLARMAYKESCNHLFMAACGFGECLAALASGDIKRLGVAFPMYLMDLHVSLEQQVTKADWLEGKEVPWSHSLMQRYCKSGLWQDLDEDQKQHLRAIDQAIIWYRYPHSSLSKCQAHNIPEGLKWLSYCSDLLSFEYETGRTVLDADKQRKLAEFIIASLHHTITLLVRQVGINADSQAEVLSLAEIFASKGYVESRLIESLDNVSFVEADEKPVAASDLLQSIKKIGGLAVHTEGSKESRLISNALKDVQHHYMRLLAVRQTNEGSERKNSLSAWSARNLMNVQWLVEQLLTCYYISEYKMSCYQHDFKFYGSVVDIPEENLSSFNFGTFHYPQRRVRDPLFAAWVQSMEDDRQRLGEQNFVEVSRGNKDRKKIARSALTEIDSRSQRGIEASLRLLTQLIKSQHLDVKLIAV